jgi:tight adherence protein B
MLSAITGNTLLVMAVLIFVTVLLLLEGAYVMWRAHRGPEAKRMHSRLTALSATHDRTPQTLLLKERMLSELPLLERRLRSLPRMRSLDRAIVQSGLDWTVSKLLLASAMLFLVTLGILVAVLYQPWLTGLIVAAAAGILPVLYLNYRRNQRLRKIELQLPDSLDLITRALRAGHAFSSALKMAGEEMPDPAASEFRMVHDEVNFGVSLEQALSHLSERVPLTDLRYFVVAVLVQRESGGNLTEILTNLSTLIRERLRLMARVRVLSSEGRMSAWILGLMPFILAGIINLANPQFMSPLWKDPIGIVIVKNMLVLMAIGALIMRKIIKIRV